MKRFQLILLFSALGLLLVGGIFAVAGFAMNGFRPDNFSTTHYQPFHWEDNSGTGIEKLRILVTTDKVTLCIVQDAGFAVSGETEEKQPLTVTMEDGVLTVRREDHRRWYDHIGIFTKTPELTVYLPQSIIPTLEIDVDTGDVSVPEGFYFGEALIESDAGDITWGASAGHLKIECDTGDIQVKNAKIQERMQISTDTGDLRIQSLTAVALSIETDTGDIALKQTTVATTLAIETDTGDVTLTEVTSATMQINTSTGDVGLERVGSENLQIRTSTGDVKGTLAREMQFDADSNTGRVRVPTSQGSAICTVRSSTGDIRLRVETTPE